MNHCHWLKLDSVAADDAKAVDLSAASASTSASLTLFAADEALSVYRKEEASVVLLSE